MVETENRSCYTVCVFQDPVWASRGLEALRKKGFENGVISVLSKESSEFIKLFQELFGFAPSVLEINGLGDVVAYGSLIQELQGSDDGLSGTGVAATIRRVGFQPHDGFIFQTLTERGGVLVAVESESRAADVLALFHSYGGGNAAIGAWSGRV
tara:strand:+ start:10297 stop:10758 length:462 start_codon:yes stop_codon:yes gene_type:complete